MLQPIRDHFDEERNPDTKISFGDLSATMKAVMGNPPLRDIAFAAFAFGGLQALFSGFFVLFLIDGLGYSEVEAGSAFAISSFSAIWARIMWGWLAGGYVTPRYLLAAIGLVAGIASIFVASFDVSWGLFEITLVAIVFNITAISWHGLLLAETARLAPKDNVAGVTGGVLSFTSIAMMIYPASLWGDLCVNRVLQHWLSAGSCTLVPGIPGVYPPADRGGLGNLRRQELRAGHPPRSNAPEPMRAGSRRRPGSGLGPARLEA